MKLQNLMQRPYIWWVLGIGLIFIILNSIISEFYATVQYIPLFFHTLKWPQFLFSIGLTIIIGILVGINVVLLILSFKEKKCTSRQAAIAGAGSVFGILPGVCAACAPPLLGFIFGIFPGLVTLLPFRGIELQFLAIIIISGNIYYIHKREGIKNDNN